MARRRKFANDEIAQCAESFSVDVAGVPENVRAGERLRGDHPLVRAHPGFFGRDADPEDVAAVRRQLRDESTAAALASAQLDTKPAVVLGSIPTEHRLRAVRDSLLTDPATGRGVRVLAGEICDGRSGLVRQLQRLEPDLFEPAPADD